MLLSRLGVTMPTAPTRPSMWCLLTGTAVTATRSQTGTAVTAARALTGTAVTAARALTGTAVTAARALTGTAVTAARALTGTAVTAARSLGMTRALRRLSQQHGRAVAQARPFRPAPTDSMLTTRDREEGSHAVLIRRALRAVRLHRTCTCTRGPRRVGTTTSRRTLGSFLTLRSSRLRASRSRRGFSHTSRPSS
jgi:hypothetical protein